MSPRTIERALDLLQDTSLADASAAWAAVHILATGGQVPLVRRCCAVWARHALHAFDGPAADHEILRRACRAAYRYACGRATTAEIDQARREAETIAGGSTGTAFHAAAAVVRTCTLEHIAIRTSDPDRPLLVPAVFDAPWLAALAGDAHTAWFAYRRHLLRAMRALPPR